MQPVAIVTIVGVVLTVAALAAYLIRVIFILKHVNFTLGTVIAGLNAIANQTEPLGSLITRVNRELVEAGANLESAVSGRAS
ncbi:MAG: hypothetical protein ABR592_09280 [Nitriliruptorales bacterium]